MLADWLEAVADICMEVFDDIPIAIGEAGADILEFILGSLD